MELLPSSRVNTSGPAPVSPPITGVARLKYEWGQWFRMLLCAVIASAVLLGLIAIVGDPARTGELGGWLLRVWAITAVWLVGWPVWYSVGHGVRPRHDA